MLIGLVLIVIGLVFFAQALGFLHGDAVNVLWPLLLVVLGLTLLSHKVIGHDCRGKTCWCGGHINLANTSQKKKTKGR